MNRTNGKPRAVCVFCGSRAGNRPIYEATARSVGTALARRGLGAVTGGGRVGLMGAVSDSALEAGGRVVGVIPEALALKEVAHDGLSELHVVNNMHERKALMTQLTHAFLTLPGGVGTYEEFFEILSWAALGLHAKPLGILNVEGYFDPLLEMLRHGELEGFISPSVADLVVVSADVEKLLDALIERMPVMGGHADLRAT